MLQRAFVAVPTAIAVVSLVVGCAGPTASSASRPAASALAPLSELAGTWAGTFGQVGAPASIDEAKCVVQVAGDDTFTATCGPNGGANNVAKVWITLVRSGNTLYERTVLIKFEQEVCGQAEKEASRYAGSS